MYHSILFDPLTSAVLSMDEIKDIVQEMFDANKEYLGYFQSLTLKCNPKNKPKRKRRKNMKTRKILVAGLAGMMAVSVLGGCGKSTSGNRFRNTADTSARRQDKTSENMEKTVIRFWGHQNEA